MVTSQYYRTSHHNRRRIYGNIFKQTKRKLANKTYIMSKQNFNKQTKLKSIKSLKITNQVVIGGGSLSDQALYLIRQLIVEC